MFGVATGQQDTTVTLIRRKKKQNKQTRNTATDKGKSDWAGMADTAASGTLKVAGMANTTGQCHALIDCCG